MFDFYGKEEFKTYLSNCLTCDEYVNSLESEYRLNFIEKENS